MLAYGLMQVLKLVFGLLLVVENLVVVVLHLLDVLLVVVLHICESLQELAFELLKSVMVLVLDPLVVFVVFGDTVLALLVNFVQLLVEVVDVALDLVDLLLVRAGRLVPQVVVVHPVVVLQESVAGEGALLDALVLTLMVEMVVAMLPGCLVVVQAQINDVDRVVVDEYVDMVDVLVQLEQVIGAQVEVDLGPAAEVWVLYQNQVIL